MAEPTLWTYADAVDRLLDRFSLEGTAREYRRARQAVIESYRELPVLKTGGWRYFTRRNEIKTEASYTTGTVAYSASTRQFTLTGGTWPANAALGNIRVSNVNYLVQTRNSSTVITIRSDGAPSADIAAGTTFEWYRDSYVLPQNWRTIGQLVDVADHARLDHFSASATHALKHAYHSQTIDRPRWFSIRNDDRYANSLSIIFGPAPNSERVYSAIETQAGRPLEVMEYSAGTVSTTADSTTIEGDSLLFDSTTHVGAVIRFGTTAAAPTSPYGGVDGSYSPARYTRRVVSITDSNTLEVDGNMAVTESSLKYTISDMLDLEYSSMLGLFWAMCDNKFAELIRNEDRKRYRELFLMAEEKALALDERDDSVSGGERGIASGQTDGGLNLGSTWDGT